MALTCGSYILTGDALVQLTTADSLTLEDSAYSEDESSSELVFGDSAYHADDTILVYEALSLYDQGGEVLLESEIIEYECFQLFDAGYSDDGAVLSTLTASFNVQEIYPFPLVGTLPSLTGATTLFYGAISTFVAELPAIEASFQAYELYCVFDGTLPALTAEFTSSISAAGVVYTSTFVSTLPALTAYFELNADLTSITYVINAVSFSQSTYTGAYATSNSITTHEDLLYALTNTSVLKQSGTDDDGEAISAYIETGQLFFGSPLNKRAAHIHVTFGRSDDAVVYLAAPTDSLTVPTYYECTADRTGSVSATHLAPRGFNPPRGIKADTFGVKIANVDGGSLDIDKLGISVVITGPR